MDIASTSRYNHQGYLEETPSQQRSISSQCSVTQNKLPRKRSMHRSTSRASKQRRDLINTEIARLRDLLPLAATVKTRLSYLHVMSLACVYIRKGNFFNQQDTEYDLYDEWTTGTDPEHHTDFTQALHGFIIAMTSNGKLLYISENVTDYLGHSMVELLSYGGSIYDIIDKSDRTLVSTHLDYTNMTGAGITTGMDRTVFCRMNTSRNMRRRNHCADNKMVHIQGRFMMPGQAAEVCPWGNYETVFVGLCSPIDVSTTVPNEMACYNTSVFMTSHGMDMTIKHADNDVLFHLGYECDNLDGCSWYGLIHPDDLQEAADYHARILQSSANSYDKFVVVVRLLRSDFLSYVPVCITGWIEKEHTTSPTEGTQILTITCQNQIIRDDEVGIYKSMQNFFESSTKPACPSSPSSSCPTNRQEFNKLRPEESCGMCWQFDDMPEQHQCQQEDHSWNNNYLISGADQHSASHATSYSYAKDGLSIPCQSGRNEPSEFEWQALQPSPGSRVAEMVESIKDFKSISVGGELQCRYQCLSRNNNVEHLTSLSQFSKTSAVISDGKSVSERLQSFPALRRAVLKWANRMRIKQEYLPSNIEEKHSFVLKNEPNCDLNTYTQMWSHSAIPSCMLNQDIVTNGGLSPAGSSSSKIAEVAANCTKLTNTNTSIEHSSSVIAACDWNSAVPTTNCAKYLPEPFMAKHRTHANTEISENMTAASPVVVSRHCAKVSNVKRDVVVGHESLENAVGQAIGMLSSDQLHLLDEATTSLICRPTA